MVGDKQQLNSLKEFSADGKHQVLSHCVLPGLKPVGRWRDKTSFYTEVVWYSSTFVSEIFIDLFVRLPKMTFDVFFVGYLEIVAVSSDKIMYRRVKNANRPMRLINF